MGPEVNCHEFTFKMLPIPKHMNDKVSLKTTIMPFKKHYKL